MEGGGGTLSDIFQNVRRLLLRARDGLERLERFEPSAPSTSFAGTGGPIGVGVDPQQLSFAIKRDISQITSLCAEMDRLWRSIPSKGQRDLWESVSCDPDTICMSLDSSFIPKDGNVDNDTEITSIRDSIIIPAFNGNQPHNEFEFSQCAIAWVCEEVTTMKLGSVTRFVDKSSANIAITAKNADEVVVAEIRNHLECRREVEQVVNSFAQSVSLRNSIEDAAVVENIIVEVPKPANSFAVPMLLKHRVDEHPITICADEAENIHVCEELRMNLQLEVHADGVEQQLKGHSNFEVHEACNGDSPALLIDQLIEKVFDLDIEFYGQLKQKNSKTEYAITVETDDSFLIDESTNDENSTVKFTIISSIRMFHVLMANSTTGEALESSQKLLRDEMMENVAGKVVIRQVQLGIVKSEDKDYACYFKKGLNYGNEENTSSFLKLCLLLQFRTVIDAAKVHSFKLPANAEKYGNVSSKVFDPGINLCT